MEANEIERLTRVEELAKGNKRRIETLEKQTQALTDLTAAVKVMSTKLDSTGAKVDSIDEKVSELESKPAKKWEDLASKALWAVVAALIGFALAKVGLV